MKKKKKVVFPPNPGVGQAQLTRGIPRLLQNACFILGNSLPFTPFILGSKKDRSSLLQLRYSFLPFFACKSDGIGDLEQSVSLERSGWGFTFSRLVREPPLPGGGVCFHYPVGNPVKSWIRGLFVLCLCSVYCLFL